MSGTSADYAASGRPPLELKNGKTVPMKCAWTSQASIATAVPLLILGGLVFTSKRKETLRALSILGLAVIVWGILAPNFQTEIGEAAEEMSAGHVLEGEDPGPVTMSEIYDFDQIVDRSAVGGVKWGK